LDISLAMNISFVELIVISSVLQFKGIASFPGAIPATDWPLRITD